jgi:putative toxin-antitoxin system antitoxin component (TIGR02293 family)
VTRRAVEVIGDRERARRWLGTPVRALGHSTPISLLNTEPGEQSVLTVLGRLEHGIS